MKNDNNEIEIKSLKDFFTNDQEFVDALDDALILEKLNLPTKYCIELEDLEEKMIKLIQKKNKFKYEVLFSNYKRYLYKHILELEKANT